MHLMLTNLQALKMKTPQITQQSTTLAAGFWLHKMQTFLCVITLPQYNTLFNFSMSSHHYTQFCRLQTDAPANFSPRKAYALSYWFMPVQVIFVSALQLLKYIILLFIVNLGQPTVSVLALWLEGKVCFVLSWKLHGNQFVWGFMQRLVVEAVAVAWSLLYH